MMDVDFSVIEEARRARGLSQRELAREVGVSLSLYEKMSQGLREPTLENLLRLCRYLGLSPLEVIRSPEDRELLESFGVR